MNQKRVSLKLSAEKKWKGILEAHPPKPVGDHREYAVAIILWEREDGYQILFEQRSDTVSQPKDISFPGGRRDGEESLLECAYRETFEELGIPREDLDYLGPSDFAVESIGAVYPYVFCYRKKDLSGLSINGEVAEVLTMDLSYFLENTPTRYESRSEIKFSEGFPYERLPMGREYPFYTVNKTVYMYEDLEPVLWGLTAKLLLGFINKIRDGKE